MTCFIVANALFCDLLSSKQQIIQLKKIKMKMKKIAFALSGLFMGLMFYSCAPVYKCGDPIPEKVMGTKRLKTVISERDALCAGLAAKESENENLKADIRDLENQISEITASLNNLQKQYNDLTDKNLSQAEQYNKTLQAKTEELAAKEKMLLEREKALSELQQVIARQDSITKRLNDILHNALLGFNPDELSVEIKNGKVYVSMSDRLLFKSGSAAVETKGKEAIKLLAGVLNNNPDIEILVEGHTDNVPIKTSVFKDNWDLSVVRATSIVRILTDEYKIAPTRITASGRGEYFPRDTNETSEGRARNRRTEIILSPKLDEIMQLLKQN